MAEERNRWERRYRQADEPFYGTQPSAFLARSLGLLPRPGICLDLGGGEGRNAVFLAGRGWRVQMVDLAVSGVARARQLARALGVRLDLVAADLQNQPFVGHGERWDLILAINMHDATVLERAAGWLTPGGALVVEGFAKEQLGRASGGPPEAAMLWAPNEMLGIAGNLRVVWYEDRLIDGDDNPRHRGEKWVVRMIARRER